MAFPRLARLRTIWSLDREFGKLGWRRGDLALAYYRGRLHHHVAGSAPAPAKTFRVIHRITHREHRMELRSAPGGGDWIVLQGVWIHQDYDHPAIASAKRILDVGANIGAAAIWFSSINPSVELACIEADSRNVPLLQRNLLANGIGARVFHAAAGDRRGKAQLALGPDTGQSSIASIKPDDYRETEEVELMTIPDFLDELGWDRVNVIKLDVEGAERSILREAKSWLHRVDTILVEIHSNTSPQEVGTFLGEEWALEPLGSVAEPTYVATRAGDTS